MSARELSFSPAPDKPDVDALLLRPRGAKALYVFGHGAGAGMRHRFMQAMAEQLAEQGVATMRYQFPYTQQGRRRPDHKNVLVAAVRNAVTFAAKQARGLPLFAGGKSMGGRMTSQAASLEPLPGVAGLVFLGFPLHPPGKPGVDRADHLGEVQTPLLFVQGTRDKLAELDLLQPVVANLGKRATLHILPDGDHSLGLPKRLRRTESEVLAELADVIATWMDGQV